MERNYTERLSCSKETKDLIMKQCVNEFLKHHKDFKGKHITEGHILKQIADYYLEH